MNNLINLLREEIKVAVDQEIGLFERWRHTIGHGGVNSLPLPEKVRMGARKLSPRLIRIFIQEFFYIYPDHGVFDFTKLDEYMESMAATGAKVVAAICIKPKCLYPAKDASIFMPNNIEEWQTVIHTMVHRYSVERPIITHWEIGNETDIGEWGGCPYLIKDPVEYFKYYKMTAEPILEAFPEAQIGGPALAELTEEFVRPWAELCHKENVPLDFVTWHRYSDNSQDHAATVDLARKTLEGIGENCPELMITEFGLAFNDFSIEELAFHPSRPAMLADNIFAVIDKQLDWSFYYHVWDQCNFPPEFEPFYADPYIMQKHWNEVPHRFGLFGVNQEVRPSYFVYWLLTIVGDTMIKAESSHENLKVKAFKDTNDTVSTMIINRKDKEAGDIITTVRFTGLQPGLRWLKNYRLDGSKCWNEENLELIPIEQRKVYVNEEFYCQIYCPADSVSLLLLE